MTHTDSEDADVQWACARKKAYPTETVARLAVGSIVKASPGAEVRPYACRRCGLWHVGGTPPSERALATSFRREAVAPSHRQSPLRRRNYGDHSVRRTRSTRQRERPEYEDDD